MTIGFSASTGIYGERCVLKSWEFSSNLIQKESGGGSLNLMVGLTLSGSILMAGCRVDHSPRRAAEAKEKGQGSIGKPGTDE